MRLDARLAYPDGLSSEAGMDNLDPVGTALAAAIGAAGLWVANRLLGKAAFQQAINDGFAKLLKVQQEENAQLREEMSAREVIHARQIASLRGHIMNLTQALQSRDAILRRSGIPIPEANPITEPMDDIIELPSTAVTETNPPPRERGKKS